MLRKLINDNDALKKRSYYLLGMGAIFIFLLTFMVYTPTLKNDFVNWDDAPYVFENNDIQFLHSQSLYWMLTSFYQSNWHPLTWLSHAIDHALWGLNPLGHHLTNIIIHGLNTLLIFLLVLQLMMKGKEAHRMPLLSEMPSSISRQALIVAGVTSLLFGLHPLHVESVAWVSERKDLLCAFFFLLSILSYLSYTSSVVKRHQWTWFTTCLLSFILALMSKPMAVTLPLILLLLDIYPLNRLVSSSSKNISVLLEKIPFISLSIASSITTIIAQHSGGALATLERLPLADRLLNALRSLVFYLEKMSVPSKLVPFYPFPPHIHWLDLEYVISGILVLTITCSCLWMAKRKRYLFFTIWLYYVVTLLPVLGIIQVGTQAAADRYTYLPSLSIFLVVGIGVLWIFQRVALTGYKVLLRWFLLALICIIMFLLGQLTIKQIRVWRNSEILWSSVINTFPGRVPVAHNNLGLFYYEKGRFNEAIKEYRKALIINPYYHLAHCNLGAVYGEKGMLDEAISEWNRALAINPKSVVAHYNLGMAYYKKGRLDEATFEYKQALVLKPRYAEAHYNLGLVYAKKGELNEAIAEYKQALAIKPHDVEVHTHLGIAYQEKGELGNALYQYKHALTFNPNYAEAHANLGAVYIKKGMFDEAITACNKALAINPNYAEPHCNLAIAYGSKNMLEKTISECKKALAINPNFAEAHYNLGAAYANKGMMDEAIFEYKKALALNPHYTKAHYNLGMAYYYQAHYRLAIIHLDQALERGARVNPKLLESLKSYR